MLAPQLIMCAGVVGHDQRNKNIGATRQAPDDASNCTFASLLQHNIEKKIWNPSGSPATRQLSNRTDKK